MTPKETLAEAMRELGLTVKSTFVPWSKSRNAVAGEHVQVEKRSLNWRVELRRSRLSHRDDEGEDFAQTVVLACDYTAGIGHAPSYPKGGTSRGLTLDVAEQLEHETEHGKRCVRMGSVVPIYGKAIEPDACDVVASIVNDTSAID
jgi:hypothetical protein